MDSNDPYRNMDRSDIRPEFLGGKKAAEDLKKAESAATDTTPSEQGENLADAKQTEEEGFYRGGSQLYTGGRGEDKTGRGVKGGKGGKGGIKGFLKKKGPMAAIIGIIMGVGGMMGGAQSLMPMAISEMLIEKFNSVGISSTMSSDAWLDTQLNLGVRQENTRTCTAENPFAFSEYQVQQFANQGLIVVSNVGGEDYATQITAILYKRGDVYVPVVGSDMLKYNGYTKSDLINAIRAASGFENIADPVSAETALNDSAFKIPYTTASKPWRGGISGWFDEIMSNITQVKLGVTRNRWSRFVAGTLSDMSESFKKAAQGDTGKMKDEGVTSKWKEEETITDDAGNETTVVKTGDVNDVEYSDLNELSPEDVEKIRAENGSTEGLNTSDSSISSDDVDNASKVLNSKAMKAASIVSGLTTYGCAILEGAVSIYNVVGAYQSLQFLNLTSGFLESVDKVKAGSGDNSPMGVYATNLTTNGDTLNDDGEVASNKTAMQSAGMAWLFNGTTVPASDASVRNVNFENILSSTSGMLKYVGNIASMLETCGYIKAGASAVDLATTVLSIMTGGISGVFQIGFKSAAVAVVKAVVQVALYAIIPIAAKNIAQMLVKNAATDWFGEDLGNAIISGGSKYLGGNATSGGQGPAGESQVIGYLMDRDAVIAEESEYQRLTHSPFDMSSRHTFLGSIAYSLMPMTYANNGIVSSFVSTAGILSNSVAATLPTVSALDINNELTSKGDCKILESTGAVGDAFCNPYVITDRTTIDVPPTEIVAIVKSIGEDNTVASDAEYHNVIAENLDENGNIKNGSKLAKYIAYCGQRTSQYGIKDAQIYQSIQKDNAAISLAKITPGVGTVMELWDNANEIADYSWMNGSACVNTDDNPYWDTEYKYYQRYAENERLLESMNPGCESSIARYMKEYYKENPLDQSFEGTLARFAGTTKEQVEDTLALIEYYEFLNEYDPTERIAFGSEIKPEKPIVEFNNPDMKVLFEGIMNYRIVYADLRTRNFVV